MPYLRERLILSRELMAETGSVFLQIGDENIHFARCLLDEIFGKQNSVSLITLAKTSGTTGKFLPGTTDYILWYSKNIDLIKYRSLFQRKNVGASGGEAYTMVELADGSRRRMTQEERVDPTYLPPQSRVFRLSDLTSSRVRENRTGNYPIRLMEESIIRKNESGQHIPKACNDYWQSTGSRFPAKHCASSVS